MGNINEKDVKYAAESNAIIFGFEVDCLPAAVTAAEKLSVPVKLHKILFKLTKSLEGLENEVELMQGNKYIPLIKGKGQILQIFNLKGILHDLFN